MPLKILLSNIFNFAPIVCNVSEQCLQNQCPHQLENLQIPKVLPEHWIFLFPNPKVHQDANSIDIKILIMTKKPRYTKLD